MKGAVNADTDIVSTSTFVDQATRERAPTVFTVKADQEPNINAVNVQYVDHSSSASVLKSLKVPTRETTNSSDYVPSDHDRSGIMKFTEVQRKIQIAHGREPSEYQRASEFRPRNTLALPEPTSILK